MSQPFIRLPARTTSVQHTPPTLISLTTAPQHPLAPLVRLTSRLLQVSPTFNKPRQFGGVTGSCPTQQHGSVMTCAFVT